MKMIVVGCGNAFSHLSAHQSFLLIETNPETGKEEELLVDCGARIPHQLYKLGLLKTDRVRSFYLSHIHGDHAGGLDEMFLEAYDWKNFPQRWDDYLRDSVDVSTYNGLRTKVSEVVKKPYWKPNTYRKYAPRLYAHEAIMHDLWNKALSGALETTQGFTATLETFVEPVSLKDNETFLWCGWTCEPVQQIHIVAGTSIKHAYGLIVSKEGHKSFYLTTDTQYLSPEQMDVFYEKADVIIQDSEFVGINTKFEEGQAVYYKDGAPVAWPTVEEDPEGNQVLELMAQGFAPTPWKRFLFSSKVHASYAKLAGYPSANATRLPDHIKAKMWLSHYQDFVVLGKDMYGNTCDWDAVIKKDGFAGRVVPGQEFIF